MERRGIRKDIKNNIYRKRIEKVEEWVDDRSVLDETSAKNEAGGEEITEIFLHEPSLSPYHPDDACSA